MKVYKNKIEKTPCVLVLGSFDTIHLGHQKLIETAVEYARVHSVFAGVYMFASRPVHLLKSDAQKDVFSSSQREIVFENLGVDFVYYENFDAAFMKQTPEEFVHYLAEKFGVQAVVAGFNYRFGKNAAGDCETLKQLCHARGIDVQIIPAVCDAGGEVISSTRIRNLLLQGNVEYVNTILGRCYSIEGFVKKDRGVGRLLGFPTANLTLNDNILLPANGVYATVVVLDDDVYPALTNVGVRPTFGLTSPSVETHLLNFDKDLYDKNIQVRFLRKLRDERSFDDEKALKEQILADKKDAESYFSKINLETF